MKCGHCWEAICDLCDHANATEWQRERPHAGPGQCAWCGGPNEWKHSFIKKLSLLGRLSQFSRSESDFVPHFSSAFGRPVLTLSEMKALQKKHGTEDSVVKGDGADRHAPRDLGTRLKHHRSMRDAINSGAAITPARGVKIEFVEDRT